jgi:hypothetical protein
VAGYDFLTMSKKSLGTHLMVWDKLATTVKNNASELPGLQPSVEVLKDATAQVREAKLRQVTLRAAAQQASRDLEAAMEKASEAEVRLNRGLLSAYGYKSEKLVEFGLRPWRPRRPKAAPEAPEAPGNDAQPLPDAPKPRRKRRS